MTEPFAKVGEVVIDTMHGPSTTYTVTTINGERVWRGCPKRRAEELADGINTAARKYAADKIREAATTVAASWFADWLRSRADAVERGEA